MTPPHRPEREIDSHDSPSHDSPEEALDSPGDAQFKKENKKEKAPDQGKATKADLTHKEDLSIAVMNLVSLEEHLAMTSVKTGKVEYLHVLSAVRKLRIKLLKRLVSNTEGELWCISKHLLAASMRIMESATKYLESDPTSALELEKCGFDVYSLFWLLQEGIGPTDQPPKPEIQKTSKAS